MAWRLHCLQNCGKNWTSAHHMCVISSWIPQQTRRMRFIIDGQKYDFSVFEVRSIGEAAKDHKNALNLERIRYAAHLAKKYHHGTSAHHMVLIKTAIFPLLFQCFTRALRDLASFYPLLIFSTVVINFPSVLLKFAIAFPFFSHCFTSYSLICSLFIPNFRHMAWRLHCLQNLGKNWTSAHHMCVISSYRNCNFPLLFHYAIKDHKNALNLERIRYAAHLAKKYHHGTSAHHMVLIKTAIFPLLFQCFTRALRDLASFYPLLIVSTVAINFPSVLLKFAIAFPFFSHCFTSYSLICSLFIPNFRHMAWRLHCLQNLGKNWTSAHHMCVISSYRNCNFPLLFHYAIMVPHRSLNFTWHHFTLSLFFPPFFLAYQFSKRSTQIFHCFPIFSIVLYHSLSFFPLFFS